MKGATSVRLISFLVMVSVPSGCLSSETGLIKSDADEGDSDGSTGEDDDGSGSVTDGSDPSDPDCYRLQEVYDPSGEIALPDGFDVDRCHLVNTEGVRVVDSLSFIVVESDEGSTDREPPSDAAIYVDGDEDATNPYTSYPFMPNYETEAVYASVGTEEDLSWSAEFETEQLGGFAGCSDTATCAFEWVAVVIEDRNASETGACSDYLSPELRVCFRGGSPAQTLPVVSPAAKLETDARCEEGSGRFRLVPTRKLYVAGEKTVPVVMVPVQTTGTGSLTADASITWIRAESGGIPPLSVVGPSPRGPNVWFDGAAFSPEDVLKSIPLVGVSFMDSGPVGGAPFILELEGDDPIPVVDVSISWFCNDRHEELVGVAPPVGYVVSLHDLGCVGGWPQKLAVRPRGSDGNEWATVELYGRSTVRRRISLRDGGRPGSFHFAENGLKATGMVVERASGKVLEVTLSSVTYNGVPICMPGVYRLEAEQ